MTSDSEMAKDITQDVFIKAYTAPGKFRFKYRFFIWLYRIAINETLNHLKSRRRFESLDKTLNVSVNDRSSIMDFRKKKL